MSWILPLACWLQSLMHRSISLRQFGFLTTAKDMVHIWTSMLLGRSRPFGNTV